MAVALVLAQLRAQLVTGEHPEHRPLGLLYLTDHFARAAQDILDHLGAELPWVTDWAGTVGVAIAAGSASIGTSRHWPLCCAIYPVTSTGFFRCSTAGFGL